MSGKSGKETKPPSEDRKLKFLKLSLMFVTAVTTIYFAQTREMREAAATASPSLKSYMVADSTKPASGIMLENSGLGPLFIKSVDIRKRGNTIPVGNNSYSLQEAFDLDPSEFSFQLLHSSDAIKNGEARWLVKSVNNSPDVSSKIRDVSNNISIVICYCSVKNKCQLKVAGVQIDPVMACS